jgi:hypothetical protein
MPQDLDHATASDVHTEEGRRRVYILSAGQGQAVDAVINPDTRRGPLPPSMPLDENGPILSFLVSPGVFSKRRSARPTPILEPHLAHLLSLAFGF